VDGWIDRWMDGWMDGWVDGWMDGWMDGVLKFEFDVLAEAQLLTGAAVPSPYIQSNPHDL